MRSNSEITFHSEYQQEPYSHTKDWVSRMEKANDHDGYQCSGFEANGVAREWRIMSAQVADLLSALRELHDFSQEVSHYRHLERSKEARAKAAALLNRLEP